MGLKKVRKATKRLNKAVRQATVKQLQREFRSKEEALRSGALKPNKKFKDVPMRDYVEDINEDGR